MIAIRTLTSASEGARHDMKSGRAASAGGHICQLHLQDYVPVAPVSRSATGRMRRDEESLLCLVPPSPRLPARALGVRRGGFTALTIHGVVALALTVTTARMSWQPGESENGASIQQPIDPPRMVFLLTPGPSGGGGGGGKRQTESPPRAQAVGHDTLTLHVATPTRPTEQVKDISEREPAPLLDARALSSGVEHLFGLPIAPDGLAVSAGSGTGGGVGDGTGAGSGSGTGPGLGRGSGGGFGGGVYRAGNGVEPPRVIRQVNPRYSAEALVRHVEGTVILEVVVGADGVPDTIRVTRSLDPNGLDQEAIKAARDWLFVPGRFKGAPVAVLVSLVLDFHIR